MWGDRNAIQRMEAVAHGANILPHLEQTITLLAWLVDGGGAATLDVPLTTHEPFPDHTFRESLEFAIKTVIGHIHWVVAGVLVGMLIGTVPGMGGVVTLTIILPFTIGLERFQAFTLMAAAVGATTFSGSITAILINTPGTSSNAATLIDGYPLTQKGEAATAVGASALSSAAGAILANIVFISAIPIMIEVVLLFGPAQIFWIVLFAIIIIPLFVADNDLYGILLALFGAFFAFVGRAPQSTETRFTLGVIELESGVTLVAMLIGFFAIAEILRVASLDRNTIVDFETVELTGSRIKGIKEVWKYRWMWFRCSLIGMIVGAIPGAGGSAAAFVAYAHGVQSAEHKEMFGKGAIEGVIAPESANDAKDGGQLFPTLGLGVPGSGSMAVFLAGMLIHGVLPGPRVLDAFTELVIVVALSLLLSNILTSVIGLVFADKVTEILRIPIPLFLTFITILSFAAVFLVRNSVVDLVLTLVFALFGLVLIYLEISRIPFLIAFILGAILERNFWLTAGFNRGELVEAFTAGPVNTVLIGIFVLSLVFYVMPLGNIIDRVT